MSRGLFDMDEVTGRSLDWALFRRFLHLVVPYRRNAIAAMVLLPLATAARLLQPYLLMLAIDRHIVPGRLAGLEWILLLFLLTVCAESLLGFGQSYLAQDVGQQIMADLRTRGFARLLRLPVSFFDRHPSGRLVTRLSGDVENVGELFGSGVVAAFGELFSLVFIVALMWWLNPQLTLVAFVMLPALLLVLWLFRRSMRSAMRQVRSRVADLNGYLAERIAGIHEVRLFGQEQRTLEEFGALQERYRQSSFRSIYWDAFLFSALEILSALAIAGILWQGGRGVLAGTATFGALVAFVEYVQRFYAPLRKLSAQYSLLQSSNASLERVFQLLDEPLEGAGKSLAVGGRGALQLQKVCFSYDGRTPVLQDVCLSIDPGQTVALVGDTGSGKTTVGRLLLRFYRPTAGCILLDGEDLGQLDPEQVRQRIGWVSQEPFLFAGTVRNNLDPRQLLDDEALLSLLQDSGCAQIVKGLGGLRGRIEERGKNLSAGERQLLCLVRALVQQPAVMVFDEATSRLDVATEAVVRKQMERARQGRSALIIAHRLRSVVTADRIHLLHHGRIRETGSHSELLAKNGLYARLWRLQDLVNGAGDA